VIIDAVARLVPGVIGCKASTEEESFSNGLLEYPQYTRPEEFRGLRVPEVLLSGNHAEIARWRRRQALLRTRERRPDLLAKATLSADEKRWLAQVEEARRAGMGVRDTENP
jgi:tRNA (guanine37-N1)-methyltransferase